MLYVDGSELLVEKFFFFLLDWKRQRNRFNIVGGIETHTTILSTCHAVREEEKDGSIYQVSKGEREKGAVLSVSCSSGTRISQAVE